MIEDELRRIEYRRTNLFGASGLASSEVTG
jgi:hypothetical protein